MMSSLFRTINIYVLSLAYRGHGFVHRVAFSVHYNKKTGFGRGVPIKAPQSKALIRVADDIVVIVI